MEHYSKLPGLYMQAKLRFPCHVWAPIKLANVRGASISASVQLFISSFKTHFHILMRWYSSSTIRTVGYIIVCLIWSSPILSAGSPGCVVEDGNCGGCNTCTRSPIPVSPTPLISDHTRMGPGTAIRRSCCNFVSLFPDLCVSGAWRFFFAPPLPKVVPGVQ